MHNFEQVRDVLDYAKTVHADLRKFYDNLNQQSEQERVKMLLDYLSRHEDNLEETLERFEAGSQKQVLETWMQYAPTIDVQQMISCTSVQGNMSVDDVVKLAVEFDDALVELFREAAAECDIPRVREVFTNLVELENQEKLRLVRDALFDDM